MRRHLACFLMCVVAAGCGGGGEDGSPTDTDRRLASVVLADGNNQVATVGTELPFPLQALLLNGNGVPIPGYTVNFRVVAGGGVVFAGAATSDVDGIVRERWTLGTEAGEQRVEVRAVDSSGTAVVYAVFVAVGLAADPYAMSIVSGNSQVATQGEVLPQPATVLIEDIYGNPTQGVSVTFSADSGGVVSPAIAVTDADGRASSIWTLGLAVGPQILTASALDFLPLVFFATANRAPPGDAAVMDKLSGDAQGTVQHLLLPVPLTVIVTDALNNPVPGIPVGFSSASGSVGIDPMTIYTDDRGTATWQGYIHEEGHHDIEAFVAGLSDVNFALDVAASSHDYDGMYDCTISDWFYDKFRLSIVRGENVYEFETSELDAKTAGGGLFNEIDGTLTNSTMRQGTAREIAISGQMTIGEFLRVTGAGTYKSFPDGSGGTWSCDRIAGFYWPTPSYSGVP